jgi:protein phosphatase
VQELVDCGTITVQEAENHPQKNIITRALGVDMRVQPEYSSTVMLPGDLLLLCTDGLSNAVPTAQMEQILTNYDFYDVPDRLIEAANAGGGQDNITALLMEMEPTEVKHG